MQHPSRSPAKAGDGNAEQATPENASPPTRPSAAQAAPPAPSPSKPPDTRFVGHAMKALFESSDVSIKRGDETRVMSRAQDALAEIHRKTSRPPPPPDSQLGHMPSSRPPAPRVDAVLWLVLAGGLFAIAGWMIAYAL